MAMFSSENSIEPASSAVAKPTQARKAVSIATEANPIVAVPGPSRLRAALTRAASASAEPDAIAKQHGLYTSDKARVRSYFSDYQQKSPIMQASAARITTKRADTQTVSAMLDLAQSRGWNAVKLKGTQDFQREAWVQAKVRGIATEGYKPTATDTQEAVRRTAAMAPVVDQAARSIPVTQAPASQAVVRPTPEAAEPKAAVARPEKVKAPPAARSKAVWGVVEATGQKARAADVPAAVTAAATA